MVKKIEKKKITQSPYQIINQWLFDGDNMTEQPPINIINALNPCMMLQSFSNFNGVTIFLNQVFNNFLIYQIDKCEFFHYLKELIIKKRILREKTSFFKHHKEDKDITLIHSKFPQLKRYEVSLFLEELKKDEDYYDSFLIALGMKQEKKSKLNANEKKEIKERMKVMKEIEEKNKISITDWEKNFS